MNKVLQIWYPLNSWGGLAQPTTILSRLLRHMLFLQTIFQSQGCEYKCSWHAYQHMRENNAGCLPDHFPSSK